jgi:hypothetical protein
MPHTVCGRIGAECPTGWRVFLGFQDSRGEDFIRNGVSPGQAVVGVLTESRKVPAVPKSKR